MKKSKPLTPATLKKFLNLASEKLRGDWLLMGGTVLPVLGRDHRVTTDIDFVCLGDSAQSDTLKLMEIAESLQLPVETINQAGAYFLSKIPFSKKNLILIQETKSARIFRPDATLYLLLKIKRMSESDLLDCVEWLKVIPKLGETLDGAKVSQMIEAEIAKGPSLEKSKRLRSLLELLPTA